MKKALLFTTVLVFVASLVQAQITKGSVLLGGNIGFATSKNVTGTILKQNSVSVSPVVGLAVKENLVVGIAGSYYHSKINTAISNAVQESNNAGGGFFVRRYFPVAKNVYLFGEGSISYFHYHSKETDGSDNATDSKSNNYSISMVPGLAYAVSKKFHLEAGLGNLANITYSTNDVRSSYIGGETSVKGHSFGIGTSLSSAAPVYVGFRFFFSK